MPDTTEAPRSWLDRPVFARLMLNWESVLFALILLLAVVSRFYDLGTRVMSHDESLHTYYSWNLYRGAGFQHTPLMHGPLQFHLIALSYFLFGDGDFSARIPAALASVLTIAFLWAYRRYLGRVGTLVAAALMLISPYMLYYGRYTRNEALVALFGVVMLWAMLRYLETGAPRYLYWLSAALALHYTAKETAFIYQAQAMLFLGLWFVWQVLQRRWASESDRMRFGYALSGGLLLGIGGLGFSLVGRASAPLSATETATPLNPTQPVGALGGFTFSPALLLIALAGLLILLALLFLLRGYTWERLRRDRTFSLLLLMGTLVLPQLAPFPVRLIGWNPLDYTTPGMVRTALFLVPLALLSIAIGLLWNGREWLRNAAIFYAIFTVFYTTVFTNGPGFFTGLVGSLGYWLEQQGVHRGSQPWYYYILVQVPVYEYLPALGTLLAAYLGLRRRPAIPGGNADQAEERAPALALFGFWAVTSLLAYTIAGEKMPWLTVHITLPFILCSGWALGQVVERTDWQRVRRSGWLAVLLMPVFLLGLASAIGSLLGPNPPFQGKELAQLQATSTFLFAVLTTGLSAWAIARLLHDWEPAQVYRLITLAFFGLLAFLTVRTAIQAAYINYDNATEYLVYAHSARGVKDVMAQVEEISRRTTNGLDIVVAYDDDVSWPFTWYLRNYRNQRYYGANPDPSLRDAPIILVGDNNFGKIEPIVGKAYYRFDFIRMWWPNQDYFGLTWERIRHALSDPQMRQALFQIWFNRDYTLYGQITGKDMSLANWNPSDRMRLYIRKDVAAQIWDYGVAPTETVVADPYEGKQVALEADAILQPADTALNYPHDLEIAPDGSLYVADSRNHRILHLTRDGEVLHAWGSFGQAQGDSPALPGTFNEPWGLGLSPDGQFVYVADTWNHRIQKFTADGQFVTAWGYFGTAEAPDAFWGPRDVEVDAQGRVFVTDTGNKRIVVFDADGNFLTQFGTYGVAAGQFNEPVGLALDNQGRVYVADTWNQRVQVFRETDGVFIAERQWEVFGWFGQSLDNKPYLDVDANGNVFVTDPEGYRVLQFDAQGNIVRYWGGYGVGAGQIGLAGAVAVDPNGGLWLSDAGNNRLMHFTP